MRFIAALGLLILALIATSSPRGLGDAGEYYAIAINVSRGGTPALTDDDIAHVKAQLQAHGLTLPDLFPQLRVRGRQNFEHFWLYPVLAAPIVVFTEHVHLHPNWAFTFVNLLCFLAAASLAFKQVGARGAALLFVSPIVWWIDKAHSEVLTFSLLVAALVFVAQRPEVAFLLIGVAAMQNPTLIVVLPMAMAAAIVARSERKADPRFWAYAGAAVLVASVHPLYSLWRLGIATPLALSAEWRWPAMNEVLAVVLDPNIGLVPNAPLTCLAFAFVAGSLLWKLPRRALMPAAVVSLGAAAALLGLVSQTTNLNHGGTRGMSRYALWLIPLSVPWLYAAKRLAANGLGRVGTALVAASCLWSIVAFHPALPESHTRPTALALALWTQYPSLNDPPPEIFAERLVPSGVELPELPVGTPSCSKLLLDGGRWPLPCPPRHVPEWCLGAGQLCYANKSGAGYRFVRMPARQNLAQARMAVAWPDSSSATSRLQTLLAELGWKDLRRNPAASDGAYVRSSTSVHGLYVLQGPDRLLVFITVAEPGGSLQLRLPDRLRTRLVELDTGRQREVELPEDASGLIRVQIPPGDNLALVATRES